MSAGDLVPAQTEAPDLRSSGLPARPPFQRERVLVVQLSKRWKQTNKPSVTDVKQAVVNEGPQTKDGRRERLQRCLRGGKAHPEASGE